jgi:hypothetical protein
MAPAGPHERSAGGAQGSPLNAQTASPGHEIHGEPRPRDQFLGVEDLDLANLPWGELLLWWDLFLRQAQHSNDLDVDEYSHGVFALPRSEWPAELRDMGRASRTRDA